MNYLKNSCMPISIFGGTWHGFCSLSLSLSHKFAYPNFPAFAKKICPQQRGAVSAGRGAVWAVVIIPVLFCLKPEESGHYKHFGQGGQHGK
jgi:hypothetical protein